MDLWEAKQEDKVQCQNLLDSTMQEHVEGLKLSGYGRKYRMEIFGK